MVVKPDFKAYEANPNKTTGMRLIKGLDNVVSLTYDIRTEVQIAQDIREDIQEKKG